MSEPPEPPEQCDVRGCERPPDPAGSAFCLFHAEDYEREQRARHDEHNA